MIIYDDNKKIKTNLGEEDLRKILGACKVAKLA